MNEGNSGATTSLSLIERARANDALAWKQVQELYAPLIVQWCRWAGVHSDDVADIGQDVFLAVTRNIKGFKKDQPGQTFRGWLRAITQSKIVDVHRARAHAPLANGGTDAQQLFAALPDAASVDESSVHVQQEVVILYRRAMEIIARDFPPWYGQAVWSLVVDDHAPEQVAEQHQVRISAVYNAKARVLRRLRLEFAELID